jgi:hypothetical protein
MDQAMEHFKEFLRQCIKYRFWISLGVAALFAIIAYFLGSGPVQAKADQQTKAITAAANDVKQYANPGVPNGQYKPIVDEKTGIMTKDVNSAWKQLFDRQKDLLSWPKPVEERFRQWGRTWPQNVAEGAVEVAKYDYIQAYPEYVEKVYQVCQPFNYETGSGVVAAPPKETLLRPSVFDPTKLPDLGKIWAGQERLWIQRTVLEVIAQVNKKAKDWDSAIIKQVNLLDVGNQGAQDQRSIAKGEQLEESEAIKAPGSESEEAAAAAEGGGGGAGGDMMRSMMGAMGRRGYGMRGGSGMGDLGAAVSAPESIFYVKPEKDKGQYKIVPIMLSVLVDQDHIQDLLVELENSPMSIQVMDFELLRPTTRVTKPEKGTMANFAGFGQMMGGMMRGRMGGMGMMAGYGGMAASYGQMMMGQMRGGYGRGGMNQPSGMMGMMGMMGYGGGPAAQAKKGTDKRSTNRAEVRKEATKAVETAKGPTLFDPYYDIVEVKVYGQARFYNPPPADAEVLPSLGEATATAGAAAPTEPAKTEATAGEPTAKVEPAKTEPASTEPGKAEPAKAEATDAEPAKTEPAKTESPQAEPAKTEPAKTEPTKAEAAKGTNPAPESPKS